MRRVTRLSLIPAALAATTAGAVYGGWAVTTVQDFPDHARAGKPLTLAWTVRQHGVERLGGLTGHLEAVSGSSRLEVPATAGREPGQYTATLTLPDTGQWTLSIRNGFGPDRRTLPPLRVVGASSAEPAPLSEAARGERLFAAKGCVTCHVDVKSGPALGGRRYDAAWLADFLANPRATPALPRGAAPMPNLGLQPREVAALAAYVNGPLQTAQR